MSSFYKFAYRIGMKPWEEMASLPIAAQISSLFDREEREREPPYGAALDLGCGTGIWSVDLATRGWRVTGVDLVPKALEEARRRVRDRGVEVRLVEGDMTELRSAGVGSGFRFVVDLGAIHGLTERQRAAVARELGPVTTADATMLLLAWRRGWRGPLPRGMDPEEVRAVFSEWKVVNEESADVTGAPWFIRKADARFYRLRRQ